MPIANILLREDITAPAAGLDALIDRWSRASGISASHMTVNLMTGVHQAGAAFDAMAFLYLPTLWSGEQVDALQTGLATAIGTHFAVPPKRVQIIVTPVQSGHAAVGGTIERW
jgi:hypothetical protein